MTCRCPICLRNGVPTGVRWHIIGIIITWHIMYGAFVLAVADHVYEGMMP